MADAELFYADPDPTFHADADPDLDPIFLDREKTNLSSKSSTIFSKVFQN